MSALFSVAVAVAVLASLVGFGSVFQSCSIGPPARRLGAGDAVDALAVSQALYRAAARRNETAIVVVGPALLAATAASDGRIAWSQWWVWVALAAWALSLVVRSAVVQPARRAALVVLGELAGSRSVESEAKRAQAAGLQQRAHAGLSAMAVLCLAAVAAVVAGTAGGVGA
ncbi:MAG: hypothetical protein IT196_06295 [Acidimicrobiales bacterium]|nr:hypothetical protein [Acidimicrobiales bacterium]